MLNFEHPQYLYLLLTLPVLVLLYMWTVAWRKKTWKRFGERPLVNQLLPNRSSSRKTARFILLLMALAAIVTGLANLRMGIRKEMVVREGADVIIGFDLSKSMLAEDIRPNRLTRAKLFVSGLLNQINNDKIGLVVFAGNAYQQMPLTVDGRAALMYLNILNTDMVPRQGTALGDAIRMGLESFNNGEEDVSGSTKKNRAIILITDGEDHDSDAIQMAEQASKEGVIIYTIGVGTLKGSPIPVYRRGVQVDYKKDKDGNIVLSKLNEDVLKSIATASGGAYYNLSGGQQVINEIEHQLSKLDKSEGEEYEYTAYRKHFQVFLGIGLFLLLLEFIISDRKFNWGKAWNLFGEQNNKNAA